MSPTLPQAHHAFLRRLLESLKRDERIVGIMAGGSYLTDSMDEYSDLDLVIAVHSGHYDAVMAERKALAASLGRLLAAFTGEHVGEPRLLICLYDAPVLHVDLKFVSMNDVAKRVEDPAVLWEREGLVTQALTRVVAQYPMATPAWIEERFWIWVHYGATRIARGELFEAIDFLSALRNIVLGPMGLRRAGMRPQGVRKIELLAPAFGAELQKTVARYDAADCLRALRATVEIYRTLRDELNPDPRESEAERAAMTYLSAVEALIAPAAPSPP